MAQPPQEWFLNTPVLWLAALVLIVILRGPLRYAPGLLKKPLRFVAASCIAFGTIKLAMSAGVLRLSKESSPLNLLWFFVVEASIIGWIVSFFWIFLSRTRRFRPSVPAAATPSAPQSIPQATSLRNVPSERFADVGGLTEAKAQIRQVVEAHLTPERSKRYGLLRNGILLYGPRGTGKTFLATAAAGEFGLHFEYISSPKLLNRWIGATGENIQGVFAQAATRKPVLLFIDEIDSLGAGRQDALSDPGGAAREFNNVTMALMSAVDHYRAVEGLVLMAATNRLDGLDEALIREGRFDIKIRIDLPDEAERIRILEAQLSRKPSKRFALQEFARQLPGASAAKLSAIVNQAATYAMAENRKISPEDLRRALVASSGNDKPQLDHVDWDDVVLETSVIEDLKSLVRLLDSPERTRALGLRVPTGVLLVGPPGTGKTMIARLVAFQTKRSFYPLTAANVLGGGVGDSAKRVAAIFARAKEHSPSVIFLDEMDGLLPTNNRYLSQHDIQLVEQFLAEISALTPEHNVFLVGTTNYPENIDARVLRGGRFSEKILIQLPSQEQRARLLSRYLEGVRLDAALTIEKVAARLDGFAPADLDAICTAAKRMAFNRLSTGDQLPPLNQSDFDKAVARIRGSLALLDGTNFR